ncbi:MAG: 30S ribosomal protein S20 [bacterium]|nr:30S ribosomal protein S20 [bacterium]
MANHKSAIKRNRQNIKKREANKLYKSTVRSSLKKARAAIVSGEKTAKDLTLASEKMLAKATSRGLLKKKTASRLISRLSKKLRKATK